MSTNQTLTAMLVLALTGSLGCAAEKPQVMAAGPQTAEYVSTDDIRGPFAQSGTQFSVILDQELDTKTSYVGQPFTATVGAPIYSTSGRIIVPKGATLEGEVVNIGQEPSSLTLHFSSIKIGNRRTGVDAKIVTTGAEPYESRVVAYYPPHGLGPSIIYFPEGKRPDTPTPHGAAMELYGYYGPMTLRELKVPKGSTMQLELTRPLLGVQSSYIVPPSP